MTGLFGDVRLPRRFWDKVSIDALAPSFQAALPRHITVEKFTRVAMTAIQNNPDLQNADRNSLFGSIVRLAQDGLLPDGREAAIVMFGNKAQAMPMIAGILKKIRQSGEVSYVSAQIVYANDHFKWTLGFDETIDHVPAPLDEDPGEPVAAYAVAVLKDGSRLLEVMRKSEIEKVRNVSRAKGNGPWVQWWGEMARKTVMRRLSKRLPTSTDVFDRDETMAHEPPAIDQVAQPGSRLDRLEERVLPNDGTLSPDNPGAGEGMADADRGERTSTDELIDLFDKAATLSEVNDATKAANVLGVDQADWEEARDRAVERIGGGK